MANLSETTAECNTERRLQDMISLPYEILHEIFRGLSKNKLIEVSRLCSRFRDAAGDTRFWKNEYIRYRSFDGTLDFEDLYSEPWPVKVIDLAKIRINPLVSSDTGQRVKVKTLNLSITGNAIETILTKYQCRELNLRYYYNYSKCHIVGIPPKVFLKQTALEVLSLEGILDWHSNHLDEASAIRMHALFPSWLVPVVSNCKNLKTLDLGSCNYYDYSYRNMLDFAKNLPASLEKLLLPRSFFLSNLHAEHFFGVLVERTPNLRELQLSYRKVICPSLLKFQFLEALRILTHVPSNIDNDMAMYLFKFSALKTVYTSGGTYDQNVEFRTTLELHGISVKQIQSHEQSSSEDEHLWEVMKVGCKLEPKLRPVASL